MPFNDLMDIFGNDEPAYNDNYMVNLDPTINKVNCFITIQDESDVASENTENLFLAPNDPLSLFDTLNKRE